MAERMTDERLAEIERAVFDLEGWPVNCSKELLQALKAERQEVERLRKNDELQMNRAIAAERKLARVRELPEELLEIYDELKRARSKFPLWPTDPIHAAAVIAEESGELMQAVLQSCYEPGKPAADNVKEEAVQTAAMCLRFLLNLGRYRFAPGEQYPDAPRATELESALDESGEGK